MPDNSCGSAIDYNSDVSEILNTSCAISGCHDGQSPGTPGNFSTYAGIEFYLTSGIFSSRVFDLKDNPVIGMPPDNAVDFGGVANLEQEQLDILQMWADAGFPENSQTQVATYEASIKEIIDVTCAYAGCHNGSPGVPGDYTTYDGLQLDIDNGFFYRRVIEIKDDPVQGMPPDRADGPKDLSDEQLQLILCWVENDYPEN